MDAAFDFVPYGTALEPRPGVVVVDVGMRTVPGVIDHHQPEAEAECAASLIVKHPDLVLDHIGPGAEKIVIVTHRLPDFDALSSAFLTIKLAESRRLDGSMARIGAYARLADSASLPEDIDLAATPYAVLRALFAGARMPEPEINASRAAEGLKFMRFLYARAEEGCEILENRRLFSGIERYERAMRKVENDYFRYLDDLARSRRLLLSLPLADGSGRRTVDGLVVKNPTSFLLKEWARRETREAGRGEGFSFLLTNFWDERFILGVDPGKGVSLRGLGQLLNDLERRKRAAMGGTVPPRWYEGNCPFFNYRIVDSPQEGTALTQDEVVGALLRFAP